MSVQELESAVGRLSPSELAAFAAWFEEFVAEAWDKQLEADVRDGKLDHLAKQADEHFEAWSLHPALNHFATPDFWFHYRQLPPEIRDLADKYSSF